MTVKGTVFTVSWDAATEKFELKLRHGGVTVSGPLTSGEIALRAGQRLLVDLPRGETVINEQKPEERVELPAGSASRAAEPPWTGRPRRPTDLRRRSAKPSARPAGSDGDRRWAAALAAGQLDRIIGEAERAGVKATLDTASSDDLLALADAARYRRRMDLARDGAARRAPAFS